MYPDLSYLFHDLIGTQPDNGLAMFKTFGFFLAIAFLASAMVFHIELKRKAKEGFYTPVKVRITTGLPATRSEIISNALAGLIIGGKGLYAYQHYADFRHDPASVILSLKINWIGGVIGAALLGGFTYLDGQKRKKDSPEIKDLLVFPHDRISEMTVAAAVGGILGAKIFDLFDNWEDFLADPIGALTSGGGLAFLGGLILGFIAVVYYIWRNKIPFLPTADAVAPALVAGYGVGRIGCQLSGDGDWGIINTNPKPEWMSFLPDWMWSYQYPHHVLNSPNTDPVKSVPVNGCTWDYCMQLGQPVFPTPFYEIVMMAGVFAILWALRTRIKVTGMLFFIYLCLIAAERFLIEKIRVNVSHEVLGINLTQAEIISIMLFLTGLAGAGWLWKTRTSG